jgi:hypothetical protein
MSTPIDTLFLFPPDIPLFSSFPTKLSASDGQRRRWVLRRDSNPKRNNLSQGGLQRGKKGKKEK